MSNELLHIAAMIRDQANAVDALGEVADSIAEASCDEFADFIARWDPITARSAADLLERVHARHQRITDPDGWEFCERCATNGKAETVWPCPEVEPALQFARTWLGNNEIDNQGADDE